MQLAMAAGSTDRGTAFNTRATGLLAAGVALAGAGVIAVNPVAPMISAAAHQPAVELTATTGENLDHIMDLLTGPNPVFTALGDLGSYYGETTSNSIQGVLDGLEIMWSGGGQVKGLEVIIPQVMEFLQQGDFTNAWNLINWDMLFNMNNIFQPLFDHTVRGTGEFVPGMMGIGADLTHVWANLQEIFGDFSFWKTSAKYLTEPLIGFMFALSENLTGVPDGIEHVAQDPFDALLNGYITWDSDTGEDTGQWWGLITEQGTLSYFLDFLPGKFADALTSTIPVPEVDVDPGDAAAAASLLDFGWLDSLFN
ncbi:hypothetical protein [Mycolicibacter virginiensis]|uniref:PE-PGRS family protein n=1 Tax=Mycolicibacter virginiensis TaxID=1795032 RepID=A0A9X7IMX7_9MYCO|nr:MULTISPECIES: hypothetical protein [Mycobacteriaceae]PQM52125.1 hypothetical protein C5U48_11490 [Mycolicibacter virginiensis]ULP49067.1 hypothetical protein MJO54_08450 [Mycolicibacter virginiensis]